MTFNQILGRAEQEINSIRYGFKISILKLVVSNKRELEQLKRAFTKYQKECQTLIDNDNFDMSEYDNYKKICEYINTTFENALILA